MFTIEQIKAAHSKVKSGADFPAYVQDLIKLGVTKYETYVSDGHTLYFGKDTYSIQSEARYSAMEISNRSDKSEFVKGLKEHQDGKTNFPAFCVVSAQTGVEKWIGDFVKMTCTYYDKAGKEMLMEHIPAVK